MAITANAQGKNGWRFWIRRGILIGIGIILGGCLLVQKAPQIDRPDGTYLYGEPSVREKLGERLDRYVRMGLDNYDLKAAYHVLTVTYPYDESVFPPEIAAPTIVWDEKQADVGRWLVWVAFDGRHKPLYAVCDQSQWTPNRVLWEVIKKHSLQGSAQITVLGVNRRRPFEVLSKGSVRFSTTRDPVGAPIMYRLVPPVFSYALKHPKKMQWCLADISSYKKPDVIMAQQPVCGSCHTFSQDGRIMGMDMDYNKDKGAFALAPVHPQITLSAKDFISWNDFPKIDFRPSTGLFSRLSPDGRYVMSTVNEISLLVTINDPYCSQLFYPLRGILAYYSRQDKKIHALAGGNLPNFVQTDPSWSPDGKYLLFSRVAMNQKLIRRLGRRTIFPTENAGIDQLNKRYPVQFNVYRLPFNNGKGGLAEPLAGASDNGRSNYFARYSPDGKWIVFTQSTTGLAIQPDSELYIVPASGGTAKKMRCNRRRVNSWHTWSPNGKWLAFVSKEYSPDTELFLTHIDAQGNDSPPIRLRRFSESGYAVNVPEFANIAARGIRNIRLKGH